MGTTDFSVCELSDGMVEVLASKGDVFLGGSDFDNVITNWVVDCFKSEQGIDLTKDSQAMARIIEASEKAKIELSTSVTTEINLPYITIKDNTPIHLTQTLTRAKFEQLTNGLVERIIKCGASAMNEANVNYNELDCVLLVGGSTRIPMVQEALKNEFKVELNKTVNPDEAVAMGAAIQANIIVGGEGSSDVLLLDVTPLTLGIETMGGVMTSIVEANTTIPCRKSQIFSTAVDNQPSVTINVLQGERPMAKDNKQIGLFNLDGIPAARRGVPQIEVTFDIDANGILSVTAKDKATNKEQSVKIESKNSLSQEEIDRIKDEAKLHEEEDKLAKEKLEKINKLDNTIYQTENTMDSFKDNSNFTEDDKKFFNDKIDELKKIKESEDFNKLDSTIDEINKKWQEISAKLYAQQAETNNSSTQNNNSNNNAQEAECEVQDAQ